MSEAIEILIKADDQASAKLAAVADNATKAGAKAGSAFKDMSRQTKASSEFVGVLAGLTGSSEIQSFASRIGGMTEKVGQFSEIAKAGGGGALAFKLGLVGLAAAIGATIGKAIGDIIFQTEKWTRTMANAKERAKELESQIRSSQSSMFANRKEDIELIRDPDQKRAQYAKLFEELNRDIATQNANVEKAKREVEEWADAWQITGERKAAAEIAGTQLEEDKAKLAMMQAQREEIGKLISVRERENAEIRAANAAKEKSEDYLEALRLEVEYLKATREEQIKLDAARNTTAEDRGEAERLLRERDAIKAKEEAEKELAATRKQAAEDAARAAEKAAQDAERERQRQAEAIEKLAEQQRESAAREAESIDSLIASEEDRLELQRIELEQGKEAAKAMALVWQGVDEATAKRLAKEESELEKLKQKKADEAAKKDTPEDKVKGGGSLATLAAVESRLLTRGPASQQERWMEDAAKSLRKIMESTHVAAVFAEESKDNLADVAENTAKTTLMVPVA